MNGCNDMKKKFIEDFSNNQISKPDLTWFLRLKRKVYSRAKDIVDAYFHLIENDSTCGAGWEIKDVEIIERGEDSNLDPIIKITYASLSETRSMLVESKVFHDNESMKLYFSRDVSNSL